jgi:endoglucanase
MTELLPFLKSLITQPGLSGHELPVRRLIEEAWRPLVDEISASRLGSLHALRRGTALEPRPPPRSSPHGRHWLMVTGIVDGFLPSPDRRDRRRVCPASWLPCMAAPTCRAWSQPPTPLPPDQGGPVALERLLIDTGLKPSRVAKMVRVGDLVSSPRRGRLSAISSPAIRWITAYP